MKIIGVDEVGRGSGAGPIMACAFIFLESVEDSSIKDSKKMSAQSREETYKKFLLLRKEKKVDWSIVSISNEIVDKNGIQKCNIEAIRIASKLLLEKIKLDEIDLIVDGNFKIAPIQIENRIVQAKSVIKADRDFKAVSAASIVAKVTRDRYMCELNKKYPEYFWAENSGYLTKNHCEAITTHGLSPFHRKSFCHKFAPS